MTHSIRTVPTEALDGLGHRGLDLLGRADITRDVAADQIRRDDLCALLTEPAHDRSPDAGAAARDECFLARQSRPT